jgi:choline dehydrogenase
VLSAGAIGSPQLLLLSGIGPEAELKRLGISVEQPQPGVGENLMDHLEVYFQQASRTRVSLNRWLNPVGKGLIGARWLLTRGGLGGTNHFEVGGFLKSDPALEQPDIQLHFLPAAVSYDGRSLAAEHGFQAHVGPMLSPSRGTLRLRSADPAAKPVLRFNYMSAEADRHVFRAAIRHVRHIFSQPALDAHRGAELSPGAAVTTDEDLDAFVAQHAESAYHPCGTCRMGTDERAVVDPEGRVRGVEGLRVADSSVFPHITNGNLNAPTVMLAEKIAAAINETPREGSHAA